MSTLAMSPKPETTLIHESLAAARRGDGDAFANLVSPHMARLQKIALRFTRNPEDAEDVCQEALLKAFTKLDQFSGIQVAAHEFRAWLTRITTNCAIDFLRRKDPSRFLPLEEYEPVPGNSHQAAAERGQENPETLCVKKQQAATIATAITSLPADLRTVCLLRNMMELSTKEAAARLGISTLAVRLRLFRAHGQLRKSLSKGLPAQPGRSSRNSRPIRLPGHRHVSSYQPAANYCA
jgi:RNA polymerase sigma-70 factor, ECF subfamily